MKKKFSVIVCVVIALLVSLSLAACGGKKSSGNPAGGNPAGGDPTSHTHEYAATYQRDDAEHWRECKTCGETTDRAMHEFDGGNRCTVCGYEFTAGLSFRDVGTDECHLKNIGTATKEADIIIPASYDGRKVTGIDSYAFRDCANIRSVTIPSSIKTIGTGAFNGCTALGTVDWNAKNCSQVTLPIFDGCTSLNIITVKEDAEYLPKGVFSDCSALETLTVPFVGDGTPENSYLGYLFGAEDYNHNAACVPSTLSAVTVKNATAIGDGAFYNCSGLTEITLPANATSIGAAAFKGCTGLKSIYLANLIAWCNAIFEDSNENPISSYNGAKLYIGGNEITELVIPQGVTAINDYVFYNCASITSVTLPNSVTSIGDGAFRSCSNLSEINIPASVTSIGNSAFSGCGITTITIPESVTSIGNSAFSGCGITTITIPASVTSIGSSAFYGCSSLESIYYNGDVSGWCSIDFKADLSNRYDYYSVNQHDLYIGGSKVTNLSIPQGITEIKDYAFEGCKSITSVTIPSGVTSIGDYALSGCGITTITIPESVTYIGDGAFDRCSNLQPTTTEDNIGYLGNNYNPYVYLLGATNYELTTYTINKGTKFIGSNAFRNCRNITSITIPANVTSIGEFALSIQSYSYYQSPLTITFADKSKLKSIGNSAFYGCRITTITIPESVTSIGSNAFSSSGLTSIEIPANVNYIGSNAFYSCTNLQTVTFDGESKLEYIGSGAFCDCRGLTSITIPENVTYIGSRAFSYCTNLWTVTFDDPNGWSVSLPGSSAKRDIDSSSLQYDAAQYLTGRYSNNYCDYTWTKG